MYAYCTLLHPDGLVIANIQEEIWLGFDGERKGD